MALIQYQYKMTQCNSLNVKMSSSELNKLELGRKNGTEVTLNLSWNVIRYSNDDTNLPAELSLTERRASRFLWIIHQLI